MKKFALAATTTVALVLTGLGVTLTGSPDKGRELRRVGCQAITMFTPSKDKSAEELCANYGGVADQDSTPSKQGLVILVRIQPAGGFAGEQQVR